MPDPKIGEAAALAAPVGNSALIGVPTFLAGSIALGPVLIGYVPATASATERRLA